MDMNVSWFVLVGVIIITAPPIDQVAVILCGVEVAGRDGLNQVVVVLALPHMALVLDLHDGLEHGEAMAKIMA
jgi:hypothetical protein